MNRHVIYFAALLAFPGALLAAGPDLERVPGSNKIGPALKAQVLEQQARVDSGSLHRIVVTLQPLEPASERAEAYRSREGLRGLQSRVWEAQAQVLGSLYRGRRKVLHRYESLYGFSAEADAETIAELAALPEVIAVEEMPVHYLSDTQSFALTGVKDIHPTGYNGTGVTIAIIDDGIDQDHAAFGGSASFPNAKIIGGYDFGDNDPNPTLDCAAQSHGTATTGVAVGNGGGVTGTAPGAKVVFLKVQQASECGQPSLSGDIVGAIDWAVTHRFTYGTKIISMSLGSFNSYPSVSSCESSHAGMLNAVNSAYSAGMTVIAAAGNNAATTGLSRPACFSNAISVGAVYDANVGSRSFLVCSDGSTTADKVTCYSNSAPFLDLLGPADCALTARAQGTTNTCFNGTSSAAPFTAGVAATLLQRDPNLNNDTVRSILTATGKPVTDHRNGLIKPRVEAAAALASLFDLHSCGWSDNVKESSGIQYVCPANKVLVGRQHSGDENGNTKYYCCAAGTPQAVPTNCGWSDNIRESNGTAYTCPLNQFLVGRQHSGDENGNTRYYCCNLNQGGFQVSRGTCSWSAGMTESSSNYRCPPTGRVMSGRFHFGDENGTTQYYCCNPQW